MMNFNYLTIFFNSDLQWKDLSKREVRKRAKIRNRYNQAPHLSQDTNGKVTTSQLDITREPRDQPFPSRWPQGIYKQMHTKAWQIQNRYYINDPQKNHSLRTVSKNILLEGLNRCQGTPTTSLVQMWMKTYTCLVCTKDPLLINALSHRTYKSICKKETKQR